MSVVGRKVNKNLPKRKELGKKMKGEFSSITCQPYNKEPQWRHEKCR